MTVLGNPTTEKIGYSRSSKRNLAIILFLDTGFTYNIKPIGLIDVLNYFV
jgi:hypothetical protein